VSKKSVHRVDDFGTVTGHVKDHIGTSINVTGEYWWAFPCKLSCNWIWYSWCKHHGNL